MKQIKIPDDLKKINEIFTNNGFEVYLVGGAVRDILLGKKASDWDLTTNAHPEDVVRMFKKVIPTGIKHGTVTVHFLGHEIEVTTYRADNGYSDGRHPDSITFATTIEEDLSRRDFTMNAIAASLSDGSIKDPFDGQGDIKKKIIRTVGKAHDRFMEDGLRPVRALRFSAQLGFVIEKDTYSAILEPEIQKNIASISIERFRDEFEKMLKAPKPSIGLTFMQETGVLKTFIPELDLGRGVIQADCRGFHIFDVFEHNIYACDGAPKDNLTVRISALFHDVGKVQARTVEKIPNPQIPGEMLEIIHFHKHEIYSAEITRKIMTRLRFPNKLIDEVCHLIEHHMFYFEQNWSDAAVRRFIVRIGMENIENLFELRLADSYGQRKIPINANSPSLRNVNELRERIQKVEKEKSALSLKSLKVNGNDLIKLGIEPGKRIGLVLEELFQTVLDDPQMNDKQKLLKVAQEKFIQ